MSGEVDGKSRCFFCMTPTELVCENCQEIGYCSEKHLELHRTPEGSRDVCLPFRVLRNDEAKGTVIVATRDIKPFELLLSDRTAAFGPFEKEITKCLLCLNCLENIEDELDEKNSCQFCLFPLCQKPECQTSPFHFVKGGECDILQKLSSNQEARSHMYRLITPLRAFLTRETWPDCWHLLRQLETHRLKRKARGDCLLREAQVEALALCGFCSEQDITLFEELICAIKTNSLSFARVHGTSMGNALFPLFSLFNHSCMSNCRYSTFFDVAGSRVNVEIRAKQFISRGEEVTIQYTSSLQGNAERTQKLDDHWLFHCDCARCHDNPTEFGTFLSGVRCVNDDVDGAPCAGVLLPRSDGYWKCSECNYESDSEDVKVLMKLIENKTEQISLLGPVQNWISLLEEGCRVLHPNNYLVMNIKRILIQVLGNAPDCGLRDLPDDLLKMKLDLCQNYLQVYQKVDPGYTKWRGRLLEELASPLVLWNQRRYAKGEIGEAECKLSVFKGMRYLKEAMKCRQFEKEKIRAKSIALLMKEFNDIVALQQCKPKSD